MDEFNMNLDELLKTSTEDNSNSMSGKLFVDADVDVNIIKEQDNEEIEKEEKVLVDDSSTNEQEAKNEETKTIENNAVNEEELNREKTMDTLAKYEACQNKLNKLDGEMSLLNQELESLINQIKLENKELIDKINSKADEIKNVEEEQENIKLELLPLQRTAFKYNKNDKTFNYNKIQSTYVEPSDKNKFDLKKFREEQASFWKENINVLEPYSEITTVADYIKITISKK